MNQIVNVAPKKPGGQPGNKNGAGKTFAAQHKSVIEKRLAERDAMRQIADTLIDQAIEGNMTAINTLFDRIMGKAVQHVESTSTQEVKHSYALSDNTVEMLRLMRQDRAQHEERVIDSQVIDGQTIETVGIEIDTE